MHTKRTAHIANGYYDINSIVNSLCQCKKTNLEDSKEIVQMCKSLLTIKAIARDLLKMRNNPDNILPAHMVKHNGDNLASVNHVTHKYKTWRLISERPRNFWICRPAFGTLFTDPNTLLPYITTAENPYIVYDQGNSLHTASRDTLFDFYGGQRVVWDMGIYRGMGDGSKPKNLLPYNAEFGWIHAQTKSTPTQSGKLVVDTKSFWVYYLAPRDLMVDYNVNMQCNQEFASIHSSFPFIFNKSSIVHSDKELGCGYFLVCPVIGNSNIPNINDIQILTASAYFKRFNLVGFKYSELLQGREALGKQSALLDPRASLSAIEASVNPGEQHTGEPCSEPVPSTTPVTSLPSVPIEVQQSMVQKAEPIKSVTAKNKQKQEIYLSILTDIIDDALSGAIGRVMKSGVPNIPEVVHTLLSLDELNSAQLDEKYNEYVSEFIVYCMNKHPNSRCLLVDRDLYTVVQIYSLYKSPKTGEKSNHPKLSLDSLVLDSKNNYKQLLLSSKEYTLTTNNVDDLLPLCTKVLGDILYKMEINKTV